MRSTYVDVENDLVLVETSLPSARVQELLEATGRLVLFRGLGGSAGLGMTMPAAVAIFRGGEVTGLARLVQVDEQHCVVEGTVDGLQPGLHQVRVLEYGDLSQGCASCGEVLSVMGEFPAAGDLVTVEVDKTGRAEFRCTSEKLKVPDLIGRSLSISNSTNGAFCAVIARSAGLFQNSKKVCTCDGVTMWDEAGKLSLHASHNKL